MKKKFLGFVTLAAVATLSLAACGGSGSSSSDGGGDTNSSTDEAVELPISVSNEGDVIDGGTLEIGLVSDSPFKGMFITELYEDAYDKDFIDVAEPPIFAYDDEFRINDKGMAKLDLDKEKNTATITIREDAKWNDGEPVTAEDLMYSYEIIGHPDYTSVRYDDSMTNIVGMEE